MIDVILVYLALITALGCGLMAGLFFIFSNTVMPALGKLRPHEGIVAMQSINRVILNPLFFIAFFGTAGGSLLLLISTFWMWSQPESIYVLFGSCLYLVGVMFITIRFNIPLNNRLDTLDSKDPKTEKFWNSYLIRWTRWNHFRAVASLLGTAALILGM